VLVLVCVVVECSNFPTLFFSGEGGGGEGDDVVHGLGDAVVIGCDDAH